MAPSVGRRLYVWTVALALVVPLSGCTLAGQPTDLRSPATSSPAAAPTPTPTATASPVELDMWTTVATGTLTGDDLISGDLDVRVSGRGTFDLRLLNFRSERDGDVELRVSPNVVEPGSKCTSSIMNMSYGNLPAGPQQVFPLLADFTRGDPSFLDTVIISQHDPVASANGCHVNVLASAVLDWTLPDMRPGLVVQDSGRTGGASGIVTIVDGKPLSYTVAHNDLIVEVSARLGITVDDLFYLNPTTLGSHMLYAGDVLNLRKAHR